MAQIRREQINDQFLAKYDIHLGDTTESINQKIYQFRNALGQFSPSKQAVMTELLNVIQPLLTHPQPTHFIEHSKYYYFLLKNLAKPDIEFLQSAAKITPNISPNKLKVYDAFYQAIQTHLQLHLKPESETLAIMGMVTTVFGVFSYLISDNPWFSGGMIALGSVEWSRSADLVTLPEWTLIPGIARSTASLFHPTRRKENAEVYRLLNTEPVIQRL